MASQVHKDRIVLWYQESNSVAAVQRSCRREFDGQPLSQHSTRKGYKLFTERGCICKVKCPDKRPFNQERENAIEAAFVQLQEINTTSCSTIKHSTIDSAQNSANSSKI
jgi:hypothetical protein